MSQNAPRLFIVSYLDEDVDVDLVPALRKKGYEAYSVRDIGRRTLDDEEQLQFSADRGWTLVTHNANDFKELHVTWLRQEKNHAGIIISKRVEIGRMLRALLNLLDQVSADEAKNQLFYLLNFEKNGPFSVE